MNSILLSGLQFSSLPASDTKGGVKAAGVSSFAQLLEQQAEEIDTDVLQWLQSLNIDPAALLAELKTAGLDRKTAYGHLNALADKLQQHQIDADNLLHELRDSPLGTSLVQALNTAAITAPQDLTSNPDALGLVQSALFIAQESAFLRQGNAAVQQGRENVPVFTASETTFNLKHLSAQLDPDTETTVTKRFDTLETGRFAAVSAIPVQTSADTQVNVASFNLVSTPNAQSGLTAPTNFSTSIATPITHTQWSSDLGRIMVNLTQQAQHLGPQNAEIRLDPPELGPLRIVLSVVDNVAHTTIYAAHAHTRLTVEQALPQLQQQLAQSGLSLGDANVSDQGFAGHSNSDQTSHHAANSTTFSLQNGAQSGEDGPIVESNANAGRTAPDAIIDTFA